MRINFVHRCAAHCESGVVSSLLQHYGMPISEAMAFGIGSAIYFGYFPFVKMSFFRMTVFRTRPGAIFKRTAQRLGLRWKIQRFWNPDKAMNELDRILARGIPVGVETGVLWLPYMPPGMRLHFNGHNVIVFGKEGDNYLLSDPVFPNPVTCSHAELERARFAKGLMAPRGKMFYLAHSPENHLSLEKPIFLGIKQTCSAMLQKLVPVVGVRGIKYLARELLKWPKSVDETTIKLQLGDIIMLQEMIGTGGAGFRFIYAAFLQEAARMLNREDLAEASADFTAVGDRWRSFADLAARYCKSRLEPSESYSKLSDVLMECADREEQAYRRLQKIIARG
jgi:hypothetical protein